VVIDDLHIGRSRLGPPEADPEALIDADAVLASSIA
jgi:hypothetical protein